MISGGKCYPKDKNKMLTSKQKLGANGEEAAIQFLIKEGHQIVSRNFRYGRSELDIISVSNDVLVVSEVKSFVSPPLEAAEYRINNAKKRNLISGTYGFLTRFPQYENNPLRFDVIIVDFSAFPVKITQHQGAFWDEEGWGDSKF